MTEKDDVIRLVRSLTMPGMSIDRLIEQVRSIPTLGDETARQLAVIVQAGKAAEERLDELREAYGSLSRIPSQYHAKQLELDIVAGRESGLRLVFHNLRYAVWVVKFSLGYRPDTSEGSAFIRNGGEPYDRIRALTRFASNPLPVEDRIQSAIEGLIEAAGKYKTGGKAKFSTYAGFWVLQKLEQALYRERFRDTFSASTAVDIIKTWAYILDTLEEHGRYPTEDEIADHLDVGVQAARFRLEDLHYYSALSLEDIAERWSQWHSRPPEQWWDYVMDEEGVDPDVVLSQDMLRDYIWDMLKTLTEREAGIVRLRFGMTDGVPRTFEEIGTVYGISRGRVSQIFAKAMEKLQEPERSAQVKWYLESD